MGVNQSPTLPSRWDGMVPTRTFQGAGPDMKTLPALA